MCRQSNVVVRRLKVRMGRTGFEAVGLACLRLSSFLSFVGPVLYFGLSKARVSGLGLSDRVYGRFTRPRVMLYSLDQCLDR